MVRLVNSILGISMSGISIGKITIKGPGGEVTAENVRIEQLQFGVKRENLRLEE